MDHQNQVDDIIRRHVLWAMGAGLVPLPLLDIASVTAVQLDMLHQLADFYERDYSTTRGKAFVTALAGGAFARLGASAVKALPGVGTAIGVIAMPIVSGATTFALGQVAAETFAVGEDLGSFSIERARATYHRAFEEGKEFVKGLDPDAADDVVQKLEKLAELKEKGLITGDEYEAKKADLLARM
jgi:uncharacterized protein (DUF697 family)